MDSVAFKVVDFAIQLAAILFSISFHESAHAWSAWKFGDPTAKDLGRISLNPLRHIDPFGSILLPIILYVFSGLIFGAAKPTPVDLRNTKNPRLANFVVSAAGPVSNVILAIAAVILLRVIRAGAPEAFVDLLYALQGSRFAGGALVPLAFVLYVLARINVVLAVFNLIPIPPLDGSGVAVSVIGPPAVPLFRALAPFGFLVLILLMSTSILGRIFAPFDLALRNVIFG